MRVLIAWLAGGIMLAGPWHATVARSGWSFGGELGAGYDDNVNNGSAQTHASAVARAGLGATYTQRLGSFVAVQGRASGAAESCDPSGLGWLGGDAQLRVLAKPGSGFHVPVVAVWAATGVRDHGSDIRDSRDTRGGVYLLGPLTTALQARIEAARTEREANGRAFDLDEDTWAVSLDWGALAWGTLYGEYRRKRGSIAVSFEDGYVGGKSSHDLPGAPDAGAEPDDAFGDNWRALRLDGARTTIVTLGLNVPLRADLSLDAQVLGATAQAGGFSYERRIAGVSLLLRF